MSEVIDQIDLTEELGVSTSYPIVAKTKMEVECNDAKVRVDDQQRVWWDIKLQTQEGAKSTEGEDLKIGFALTDSFLVSEVGKLTKRMIAQNIWKRFEAFGVERVAKPSPTMLVGFKAQIILGARTDDNGIERQTFTYLKKK